MQQRGYTIESFSLNFKNATIKTQLENKIHSGELVMGVEKIELKG